jgi:hypothetical protein
MTLERYSTYCVPTYWNSQQVIGIRFIFLSNDLNPEHATDQVSLHLKLCRKTLGNVEAVAALKA